MTAAPTSVRVYDNFESLPDNLAAFLHTAGERSFFCSLAWFRILLRTAGPASDRPRLYAADSGGRIVAALFMRERPAAGRFKLHILASPSRGMDAWFFGPLLDPVGGQAGLAAILRVIRRAKPQFHVLRFDALDKSARETASLAVGLSAWHLLVRRLGDRTGSFSEDVQGLTTEEYLARRSPEMQAFIATQCESLTQSGRGRFEVVTGSARLPSALVDYALVDLQSWRDPEAYANCTAELVRAASGAGILRLGLLYVDGEPAAAQIWIVSAACATLWRARFARKFALLSVAAILTFEMIRYVLQNEPVREIDYGPSDDDARGQWLSHTRERIGFAVYNLRTLKGWFALAQDAARSAKDAAKRMLLRARGRVPLR
jgi:hypothetical protein